MEQIVVKCRCEPEHEHTYPNDWIFGGANGTDPRADPRFETNNYTYYDENVQPVWVTSSPLCDDEAINEFAFVNDMGPDFKPKWLSVRRHDGREEMLPFTYNPVTNTVTQEIR